jgi:hypothetical protein
LLGVVELELAFPKTAIILTSSLKFAGLGTARISFRSMSNDAVKFCISLAVVLSADLKLDLRFSLHRFVHLTVWPAAGRSEWMVRFEWAFLLKKQ